MDITFISRPANMRELSGRILPKLSERFTGLGRPARSRLDFPSCLNENPRPPEPTESSTIPVRYPSPVAQLVERLTVNQLVAGSSPARGATCQKKGPPDGGPFFHVRALRGRERNPRRDRPRMAWVPGSRRPIGIAEHRWLHRHTGAGSVSPYVTRRRCG